MNIFFFTANSFLTHLAQYLRRYEGTRRYQHWLSFHKNKKYHKITLKLPVSVEIQIRVTKVPSFFLFVPVVPGIPSPMSASVRTIGRGEQLHHLLVFFSNRAVYAQVLRKVDSHVSSNLTYPVVMSKLIFCAIARLNLWLVRADSSCSKHNRESAEGKLNEPWK